MQRTINYTGRRKIGQKEATFSFSGETKGVPEFSVLFNIDSTSYPADASLYVEAHYKETRQRFNFGKVSRITPPSNTVLNQLDLSGPTLFRVLVVDESGKRGLLLASGEGFRADGANNDDENKSSLLAVVTRPLGQQTWKIECDSGGMPELILNKNIPYAIEKMKTDPVFHALIFPAALREVLTYYLWNKDDDEDSEIYQRWMAFSRMFSENKPENGDPADLLNWVNDVVEQYSFQFDLCDRLCNSLREED